MGRPNKTEERRSQILDAFERVILRDGYAKASQRKIAQEAGVNQPMIHHYFSGSDEMLDAMLNRVVKRYKDALSIFTTHKEDTNLADVISFACSPEFHKISLQNEVFFCLIGQGGLNDLTFAKMSEVYRQLLNTIEGVLKDSEIPTNTDTAYIIMCLIIGHDWAKKLGFGEHRNSLMASTLTSIIHN